MKKTRPIVLIAGVLVLILSLSAGVYAWFRAQDTASQAQVTAGRISLDVGGTAGAIQDKVLPGEELDLGGITIDYTGNRDAIIRFAVVGKGKLAANPTTHKDWKASMAGDYTVVGGVYEFTQARLEKVLKIVPSTGSIIEQGADNNYYTYVVAGSAAASNLESNFDAAFTGELGGLFQGSDSRQFEQECEFENVGVEIDAIQCTEDAITDVWGAPALNSIQGLSFYGTVSTLPEWIAQ